MMKRKLVCVLAISLLLGGCGPVFSLFPLYNKKDIVAQDQILGRWMGSDIPKKKDNTDSWTTPSYWEFKKAEDGAYHLSVSDVKTGKMQMLSDIHFLRLGGNLFLDVEAQEHDADSQSLDFFPAVKAHFFGRVFFEDDRVRIELLDADWCQAAILQKGIHLDFGYPESVLVLTANTDDLQKFAIEYGNDTDAFSHGYIPEHPKSPAK